MMQAGAATQASVVGQGMTATIMPSTMRSLAIPPRDVTAVFLLGGAQEGTPSSTSQGPSHDDSIRAASIEQSGLETRSHDGDKPLVAYEADGSAGATEGDRLSTDALMAFFAGDAYGVGW
jgi:hypothetical protein